MVKTVIMFTILAILWVMVVFNRKLKRMVNTTAKNMDVRGCKMKWGTADCICGKPRTGWKALAMNRPDNLVLLICPQCHQLWEEQMSLYGNKWREIDPAYAKINYDYNEEYGRVQVAP